MGKGKDFNYPLQLTTYPLPLKAGIGNEKIFTNINLRADVLNDVDNLRVGGK